MSNQDKFDGNDNWTVNWIIPTGIKKPSIDENGCIEFSLTLSNQLFPPNGFNDNRLVKQYITFLLLVQKELWNSETFKISVNETSIDFQYEDLSNGYVMVNPVIEEGGKLLVDKTNKEVWISFDGVNYAVKYEFILKS